LTDFQYNSTFQNESQQRRAKQIKDKSVLVMNKNENLYLERYNHFDLTLLLDIVVKVCTAFSSLSFNLYYLQYTCDCAINYGLLLV